ncbi:MAG: DUF11 domain-containing protein, partial [Micrococcales bacterium]|nr:DUF11 domain-containing protein [Micrococcales bacterium]
MDGVAPFTTGASSTVDVIAVTDLSITKTANSAEFTAGGLASWTINVLNTGPSRLEGATGVVTDLLEPGLIFSPANSYSGCSAAGVPASGQTITCTLTTIPAGQSVSIQIAAQVPASALTGDLAFPPVPLIDQVTNSASVSAPNDPNQGNNTIDQPVVTPVVAAIDEAIYGTVSQPVVAAGTTVTYTITGVNNGPSASRNPTSTILFPSEFQITGVSVPADLLQCIQNGLSEIDCNTWAGNPLVPDGPIALPGVAATGVASVYIPPDTPPGIYWVTATTQALITDGNPPDSDPSNNQALIPIVVQRVADTAITKTQLTNPVVAGQEVEYQIDVVNNGPSDVFDALVSDLIPPGTSYVRCHLVGGGVEPCTLHQSDGDSVLTCGLGPISVGQTVSVIVTLQTSKTLTGTLANTALVGSGANDPDASNNQATATGPVFVPPPTDVGVTVKAPVPIVKPGANATYEATVTNNGPATATGTVVTFTLPPGLSGDKVVVTKSSSGTSPSQCVISQGTATCQIGTLLAGQSVSYRITGLVASTATNGTKYRLRAVVNHNELDTVPANDTANAQVTVQLAPTTPPPTTPPPTTPPPTTPPITEPPTQPPPTTPPPGTNPPDKDRDLSFTGTDVVWLAALAAALLVAGVALAPRRHLAKHRAAGRHSFVRSFRK